MTTTMDDQFVPTDDAALGRLSLFMKVQSLVFLLYGLGWFFIPEIVLGDIFKFSEIPALIHLRLFGATFFAVGYIQYLVDRRLAERLDIVWGFALIPALLFVTFVIESANLQDVSLFFWSSVVLTLLFACGVAILRMQIKS